MDNRRIVATAKQVLGWSHTGGNPHVQVFKVQDDQIQLGGTAFQWSAVQLRDSKETHKEYANKIGVKFNVGHKFFGSFNLSYESTSPQGHQDAKYCTVITAFYKTSCQLKLPSYRLPLYDAKLQAEAFGDGYYNSCQVVRGYRLIVQGKLFDEMDSNSSEFKVGIGLISDKLNIEFSKSSADKKEAKIDEVSIRLEGFGGFVPKGITKVKASTFAEDVTKLQEELDGDYKNTEGVCTYYDQDLRVYAKDEMFDKKLSCMLDVINSLLKQIPLALNLKFDERIAILKQLNELKDAIQRKSIREFYRATVDVQHLIDEAEVLVKRLNEIIVKIIERNLFLSGEFCKFRVSVNQRDLYLSLEEGTVSFNANPDAFIVKACGDQTIKDNAFYLQTIAMDQGYLVLTQDNDKRYYITTTLDVQKAAQWHLQPDPMAGSKKNYLMSGCYALERSTLRSLSDSKFVPNKMVTLCNGIDSDIPIFVEGEFNVRLVSMLESLQQEILPKRALTIPKNIQHVPQIDPDSKQLTDTEIDHIQQFLKIFPQLLPAKDKSLVWMIGNTGSGKSALINYLLGHGFKRDDISPDILRLLSPQKLHAPMGISTAESKTFMPAVYDCYCDTPGFKDAEGERVDELNAFCMFMAKELASEIKTLVIVINLSDLDGTKGINFKNLLYTLATILDMRKLNQILTNIKFVVNTKSNRAHDKKSIFGTFIEHLKTKWEKDAKDYERYCKALDERIKLMTQPQGFGAKVWNAFKVTTSFLKEFTKEVLGKAYSKEQLNEMKTNTEALSILNLMNYDNTYIFRDPYKDDFRREFLSALGDAKKTIDKDYIRFGQTSEGNRHFLNTIEQWVAENYNQLLQELIARIEEIQLRIRSYKRYLLTTVEEQIKSLQNEIDHFQRCIDINNAYFKEHEKIIRFRDVELQGKQWRFFKGPWWPASFTKPYQELGYFTEVIYDPQIVLDAEIAELRAKMKSEGEKKETIDQAIARLRRESNCLVELVEADGSKVDRRTPVESDVSSEAKIVRYKDHTAEFQSCWVFTNIADGQKVGEYRGFSKDFKPNVISYRSRMNDNKKYAKKIAGLKDEISRIKKVDEAKKAEVLGKIVNWQKLLNGALAEQKEKETYFTQAYHKLKPVAEVLQQVRKRVQSLSAFDQLNTFLELFEKVYLTDKRGIDAKYAATQSAIGILPVALPLSLPAAAVAVSATTSPPAAAHRELLAASSAAFLPGTGLFVPATASPTASASEGSSGQSLQNAQRSLH